MSCESGVVSRECLKTTHYLLPTTHLFPLTTLYSLCTYRPLLHALCVVHVPDVGRKESDRLLDQDASFEKNVIRNDALVVRGDEVVEYLFTGAAGDAAELGVVEVVEPAIALGDVRSAGACCADIMDPVFRTTG